MGLSVLDDVGGLGGFEEDKVESAGTLTWAKSLGWSATKISSKMML